jgi:single-strand DNA-binding protein
MLNQIVIVGRLVRDPEVKETESGKKVSNITLAIPRSYKNADGEYDTDFIKCVLWSGVAENTSEYCRKGDLLGVKGRVQSSTIEENGKEKEIMEVIAEKITFLSSKKNKDEVESEDKDINI